jgi:hypothetical protein
VDYAGLKIVEALPDFFAVPTARRDIFRRLAGAKIIRIGSTEGGQIEGGGLLLDYEMNGKIHRLIFAFSEIGMWVEYDSLTSSNSAESRQ